MDMFSAQRLIGEDIVQLIYERYQILEYVKTHQPSGRRSIAMHLNLTERQVRNHLDYLYKKNIVTIDKRGVLLKENQDDITPYLYQFFSKIFSFYEKESELQSLLNISKVRISKGNCDIDESALNNLGLAAENYFIEQLDQSGLIAVSGGSTMKAFVDNLRTLSRPSYAIVPVRGAIGSSHSYQANTIAFYTSMKLNSKLYELNIPDMIDRNLLMNLIDHPDIKAVTSKYNKIDILIFGVGKPEVLAEYRHLSDTERNNILQKDCVAEALGYYLNSKGEIINRSSGIGLDLDDLNRIPVKIAVAGGASKSKAVQSVCQFIPDTVVITDEGCADQILYDNQ